MSHISKDKEYCNTISGLNKEFQEFRANSSRVDRSHHSSLFKKVYTLIEKTSCFKNVDHVLVGLSGGVDSGVLLHMLSEYQNISPSLKITAAHIHHRQRGAESDRDQSVASDLAKQMNCSFQTVVLEEAQPGMSEEALRTLRYHAFESTASKIKAQRIALGHHMDDQAETFLFRLIRGADFSGLSSMKALRHPYIRPLLYCQRREIEIEAENCRIPYVHDSSNFSNGPARNYLRNVVIPTLKAKLDPQVTQHLADLSQSATELDEFMTDQAIEMIQKIRVQPGQYSVARLRSVKPILRKKMIQLMFVELSNGKVVLSRDQIEMVDRWTETPQSPKHLELFHNFKVEKKEGVLTFSSI